MSPVAHPNILIIPANLTSNMSDAAPAWFTAWVTPFAELSAHCHNEVLQSTASLKKDVYKLTTDSKVRDKLAAETDEAELLVYGLSAEFQGSFYDAAKLVLKAMGFGTGHDMPDVFDSREWNPRRSPPTASQPNSLSNTNAQSEVSKTRAFTFFVGIASIRDRIIQLSGRLRDLTALTIFGCGGSNKVYIRPVWPSSVFNLLQKARKTSEELNYARPLVKNLRVFVRQTNRSQLVPVLTPEDLKHLPRLMDAPHANKPSKSSSSAVTISRHVTRQTSSLPVTPDPRESPEELVDFVDASCEAAVPSSTNLP